MLRFNRKFSDENKFLEKDPKVFMRKGSFSLRAKERKLKPFIIR